MTCTENYENWLNFVKVMRKTVAVVSFVILTNLYFRIPTVMQQRNEGVVEIITCTLLEILFAFQQWKNCENLLRFDKITSDYKAVPFFSAHGVYYGSFYQRCHLLCSF